MQECVCCADWPKVTGYMDSPSCLCIKSKCGHWALPASLTHKCSHMPAHTCTHCILLSHFFLLYLSLSSAEQGLNVNSPAASWVKCVCNIYFIGISPSACWVAAGHVIMFWAVKGNHHYSWDMRFVCERERETDRTGMTVWMGRVYTVPFDTFSC